MRVTLVAPAARLALVLMLEMNSSWLSTAVWTVCGSGPSDPAAQAGKTTAGVAGSWLLWR